MLRDALLENMHRAQLNPLEEAAAYQQLLEEFGATHEELARRIGRSRPQVTNTIRLLNLPLPVQRRVAAGVLSAGHARALLGLEDADQQDELAARIVAEGLSVRATEELVALAPSAAKERKRRTPAKRITAPAAVELADKLSDAFDTRVRVDLGRRKGQITVEFASIDDLERIVALMAPQLATRVARRLRSADRAGRLESAVVRTAATLRRPRLRDGDRRSGARYPRLTTHTGVSPAGTSKAANSAAKRSGGTPNKQAPRPASSAASSRIIAAIPVSTCQ